MGVTPGAYLAGRRPSPLALRPPQLIEGQSQPRSSAMRVATMRLRAPVLAMAPDR